MVKLFVSSRRNLLASVKRAFAVAWRDLVLNGMIASPFVPRALRWRALRLLGLDVSRSTINGRVFIGGRKISIGQSAFINYGAFIDTAAHVSIGCRVRFGPYVTIITGTHEIGDQVERAGADVAAPVVIRDGAWVGARAVILPGVTVGEGAVVAAGAVVRDDCSPNSMYAGVPAKLVREL